MKKEVSNKNMLFDYIKTEEDVTCFIETINNLHIEQQTNDNQEYLSSLPETVLQLLWIVTAWIIENTQPADRTIKNMIKLLETCTPLTKRVEKNAFDFIMEDCQQESIKTKYEYFKYRTFGIHSNCYQETKNQCIRILSELPLEQIIELLQINKIEQSTKIDDKNEPFWGTFNKITGQKLQIRLYEIPLTALHEAGHAIACYLLNVEMDGVTIISADDASGLVKIKHKLKPSKKAIIDYAGLVTEEVVFAPAYLRVWEASVDTKHATNIVKKEIIQELSNIREAQKYIFIDADELGLADNESPYIIYKTIQRCIELRQQAIDLISANKDMVIALAQELLEKKYMPGEEVVAFCDAWKSQNNHQ